MSINMTTSDEGNKVTIAVAGKFDFQLYDEFRASYADTAGDGVEYVVDLAETDYLDSSALGMLLLLREHATVTMCHSRTPDLAAVLREADVVVVAAGRPGLVTGEMLKPGAVVVDVGINVTEDGLVGDVDLDSASRVASAITPVPGGVGPLTNAILLTHLVRAARDQAAHRVAPGVPS